MKGFFQKEMKNEDWKLVIQMKKVFNISDAVSKKTKTEEEKDEERRLVAARRAAHAAAIAAKDGYATVMPAIKDDDE